MRSDYPIIQVSDPKAASALHAYFDLCPESPNGNMVTYFAFDGRRPGPGRVMVCRRDGSEQRALARAPWGKANEGAKQQWVGDGAVGFHLLKDGPPRSMVAPLDGSAPRVLPRAIRSYSPATGLALAHSLSAQGFEDGEAAIFLMDVAERTAEVLLTADDVLAMHPMRDAVRSDADTDRRLLHFKKPEWSGDGRHFFFVFTNAGEGSKPKRGLFIKSLFVARAGGSDVCYLGEFGRAPMWGPGDSYVYTVDPIDASENRTVVAHPIDGSEPYPLLPRVDGTHANLSPDATRIAIDVFGWPTPDQAAIWLYDVPNGAHVVAAEFGAPDRSHETGVHPHPAWSRDGSRVYFAAGEENRPALYAVDLA